MDYVKKREGQDTLNLCRTKVLNGEVLGVAENGVRLGMMSKYDCERKIAEKRGLNVLVFLKNRNREEGE